MNSVYFIFGTIAIAVLVIYLITMKINTDLDLAIEDYDCTKINATMAIVGFISLLCYYLGVLLQNMVIISLMLEGVLCLGFIVNSVIAIRVAILHFKTEFRVNEK